VTANSSGLRVSVAVAVALVLAVAASSGSASTPIGRCGDPAERPWCDPSLQPAQRAHLLLSALTRPERISLLAGDQLPEVGRGGGTDQHAGASQGVPRLGVPLLYLDNGPAGVRQGRATALPSPLALAATWRPQLARRNGALVADEAQDKGNDFLYAPTVNIMRTPVGGRTFEGYGEDPFLDAQMTVGWIKGAQSRGVIATVKHFAANNQEGYGGPAANHVTPRTASKAVAGKLSVIGDRRLIDAHVDERTLHEVYFPHFEAAVRDADVGAVMCSNNSVNGTHACRNRTLLTRVLRDEWGFQGIVMSDYGAARNTEFSLRNGLDFEPFPGNTYGPTQVNEALSTGKATMPLVNQHVLRILRTLFAFGVFDRPAYVNDPSRINVLAHAQTAMRTEQAATTLLRNEDGILPLKASRVHSIAVIGPSADSYVAGGGSSRVKPFFHRDPFQAISKVVRPGTDVRLDDGSDPDQAAAAARGANVAVVFVRDFMTEGVDRSCLTLECPADFGNEDALIRSVAAANPHTVVVLETGGPVLTPWRYSVDGLLEAWYPGEAGGTAIARVLFGKADPGGRLPATFPKSPGQIPTAGDPEKYPGVDNEEYYKEGIFVGYRWYDKRHLKPAFPFGFGLSYTSFKFDGMEIKPLTRGGDDVAKVHFDVTNTGDTVGTTVPELYLGLPSKAGLPEPRSELKGFESLDLKPGRTKTVTIGLTERDLAHWASGANDWRVTRGCYRVMVGSSSRDLPLRATVAGKGAKCGANAVPID
jgi:beta-glucosidase